MILHQNKRDVQVNGNFKTSGFGIAVTGKMFDMLSKKIYTHDVRAVIREISCNALDAHTDAGVTEPFVVHLPTTLEPWFSVRDFGKGFSSDETLRGTYCIYGYSTKENSNEMIGALGLGSKSPFAIVDSFMVTNFYGGKKTTYSCYTDEEGKPQIAMLTEEDSDEPSGVEVNVPIDGRAEKFKEEAVNVFEYFSSQPAINVPDIAELVKARQNRYVLDTPDFKATTGHGKMKALMGNVAYEIPYFTEVDDEEGTLDAQYQKTVNYNVNLDGYYKFDLGELDFDPGREVLSMNQKTKKAVATKVKAFRKAIKDLLMKQIQDEPTPYKQFVMKERVAKGALGDFIRNSDTAQYDLPESQTKFIVYSRVSYRNTIGKSEETEFTLHDDAQIFYTKPRMEGRIRAYMKTLGRSTKIILLTPEQVADMKLDLDIVRSDIDTAIPKITRAKAGTSSVNVRTFTWNGDTRYKSQLNWEGEVIDIADNSEERVYVELNNWRIQNCGFIRDCDDMQEAQEATKGYVDFPEVFGLKTSILQLKGFKKGNWIRLSDYIRREMAAYKPEMVYVYNGGEAELLKELASRTKDADAVALANLIKQIDKEEKFVDFCKRLGFSLDKDYTADTMHKDFFEKYPMLRFVSASQVKDNLKTIKEYIHADC